MAGLDNDVYKCVRDEFTLSAAGQYTQVADGTNTLGHYISAGSPEGVHAADIGSMALDATNGDLYMKTTDTANTGWVKTTGGGFAWSTITAATQALEVQNGYVGNRATAITYTLPNTAAVGSTIKILNIGAGLPVIAQNAGESINFTASTTTVGVGGTLTSVAQFGSICLVCVVADTTWNVQGHTGNWTVV